MVTNTYNRWKVGSGTFVLWGLAAACVVFWGLKLSTRPAGLGAPVLAPASLVVDTQALTRLLGGMPLAEVAEAAPPTRYSLVGVLAGTRSGHGAALIAMDGKPAKTYRVGAPVEGGLVLQSVSKREARLGPSANGASSLTLQIPLKVAQSGPQAVSAPAPYTSPMPAPVGLVPPAVTTTNGIGTPSYLAGAAGNANPPPNEGDR